MNLYDEYVVFISTDEGNGFGTVVYEDEENNQYILTCNHILYKNSGKIKNFIKIDGIDISENDICNQDNNIVDMAIVKIKALPNKSVCSLQMGARDNSDFVLVNADFAENDKNSSAPYETEVAIKDFDASLNYCHQSSKAYEIELQHEIIEGYSGSPLFDKDNDGMKVIGILNHKANPKIRNSKTGRALCVSNITKILPDELKNKIKIPKIDKATHRDTPVIVLFKKLEDKSNIYDIFTYLSTQLKNNHIFV